jgi:hypothetical protein
MKARFVRPAEMTAGNKAQSKRITVCRSATKRRVYRTNRIA